MKITRYIIINAPVEKVWQVVAHDFDKVDEWSSGVSLSDVAEVTSSIDEADMAGRMCLTAYGKCYEIFESYDEQWHTFTYKAQFEKSPPGVKSARNTWRVEEISDSQTRFTMSVNTELNLIPGLLLQIPMRLQMPRVLNMNLEEAKHFIETGKPHPRKLATMPKAAR